MKNKTSKSKKLSIVLKIILIGLAIVLILPLISILIVTQKHHISNTSNFFSDNYYYFLAFRLCLISGVVYFYPKIMQLLFKRYKYDPSIQKDENELIVS